MYYSINSRADYDDKLYQADLAYSRGDWRTAMGYYEACLQYAESHSISTSYIEMKLDDCKRKLGLRQHFIVELNNDSSLGSNQYQVIHNKLNNKY